MAKRIVNKAERNAERYDAKETGYQLYEGSLKGNKFDRLPLYDWSRLRKSSAPCKGLSAERNAQPLGGV